MQLDIDIDPRKQARLMYWSGYRVARIAEQLNEKKATIHSWKRRDKWDDTEPTDRVEATVESRLNKLILKDKKEPIDFKEIDLLGRQMERLSRVRKHDKTGNEADLNPKVVNRNSGPRRKVERNQVSEAQQTELLAAFKDSLYGHQDVWYEAGIKHRIRNILKSRQIGATWFFAREALCDALETGRNQIFLSASKSQAHQFKQYIVQFASDSAGVDLTGDPIILPNNASLYFLGTNSKTAQSYHGNLYVDEYFWINKFQELRKVASGMASHKHWRQTYFSTPSSLSHDAFPYWDGSLFNKGRPKDQQVAFDIAHHVLKNGVLCPDGQWRQIVTIDDALAAGCDLFDLAQLILEYGPDEFANLFRCQFIDDAASIFSLADMQACMVDSWAVWEDFKPFALRPLGYREVWIGYDPALTGDSSALVVLAPPLVHGGKFRMVERHQIKGMDFDAQANLIKKMTEQYNVTYIGIDTSGLGQGVYQLVTKFFPNVRAFSYSVEVKMGLVLKAIDVISKRRLEYDAGWTDVSASFMSIKKTTTPSGQQVTFKAGRSKATSHADIAWATMHAMANEPLEGMTENNQSILELS